LIEMAVVRLSRLGDLVSLAQLAGWVGQMRSEVRTPPAPGSIAAPKAGLNVPPEGIKKKQLSGEAEGANATSGLALTNETWPQVWSQLLPNIGTMLASKLSEAGAPAITGPNTLVFRFPRVYNQAREFVLHPDRFPRIEAALRLVTHQPWSVHIEEAAGETVP